MTYFIAIICVICIAIGQILFKLSASSLQRTSSFFNLSTVLPLVFALALYGLTTIAWVWVLQNLELGRIYPLMALTFILVPLGSYLIFKERFRTQYFFGIFMIITGIVITMKA